MQAAYRDDMCRIRLQAMGAGYNPNDDGDARILSVNSLSRALDSRPDLMDALVKTSPVLAPTEDSGENVLTDQQLDVLRQVVDLPYYGRRRLGFHCDAQQFELFRRCSRRTLLNCSRQSGKSTAAALKATHCAHWRPGVTILVTAPTKQQTRELLRKVRTFATLAGLARRGDRFCVEFSNGSRIIGVAADEDSIRGFSAVALVIVDEAARVADEVYYALLPMLAVSNGSLWLLSTPKGKRGFFHAEWASPETEQGSAGWVKVRIKGADCPRISAEFLAAQKKRLGERRYAQEYECLFVDLDRGAFDPEVVRKAFRGDIKPLEI